MVTDSKTVLFNPLKVEDFLTVNHVHAEHNKVFAEGKRLPSSESMIHCGICRIHEDANAVFH